jgi:hypothetical protein
MAKNVVSNKGSGEEMAGSSSQEAVYQSDEIDLVDLWIFFWDQRKLFLISVILASVLGIAGFEVFYSPKSGTEIRSLVETQPISLGTMEAAPAYTSALAKQISIVDLPQFASMDEFSQIRQQILSTDITVLPDTNIIEIVTNLPSSRVADVSRFHGRLTAQIVSQVRASASPSLAWINSRMSEMNSRIEHLRMLSTELQKELGSDTVSQTLSDRAFQESIYGKLQSITAETRIMADELEVLNSTFGKIDPRVLVQAEVSEKSTGIKKTTAYVLILFLALFLGIFIVIGNSFAARVRERMASRS